MIKQFSTEFSLALRLAVRELRGGLAGFYVLVMCIMLGVMAITTVGVLSKALSTGLSQQGRVLLGGDLSFGLVHQQPSDEQREFIARLGATSQNAALRSIARANDGERSVLVDIKAVDKSYPLTGELLLRGGDKFEHQLQQANGALVDQLLLERFGLEVGGSFSLGAAKITIVGAIKTEPDRLSGRLTLGPRVLISWQTLENTGLVQPGSLIRYDLRLLLSDQQDRGMKNIGVLKKQVEERFPQAGFIILDRSNPTPGIKRAIDRLSQFLALISLAALFIGGIGVANAVSSHIGKKREVIATFKSLGASSTVIFLIYLLQIVMLAGLGIVLGLALGVAIPPLINLFIGSSLPVKLQFGLPVGTLLLSTLYGFLVALVFMLWPLGVARKIRAAELYRSHIASSKVSPGWPITVLIILLLWVLAATTIFMSNTRFISLIVCIVFVGLYFLFVGLAALLKRGITRMPRPLNSQFAMVRASLAGPTPLLRTIILSLGIGLTMLVTISLVQSSLVAEMETGLPKDAPNFFVLDIDKSDLPEFKRIARKTAPGLKLNDAPMLRGRLIKLAGKAASEAKPSPGVEWVLRGDRGLTFAKQIPKGSVLTAGKWWPENYDGPPLVSFEEKIAVGLGLKLGDHVTVNVLGRDITAKIANTRRVEWQSLSINFVMIFSPNTLKNAPYKILATMSLRDKNNVQQEGRLISALVSALPDVTPIAVREVLAAVDKVLTSVLVAIKAANLVLLLVGAVALAGAMAATHNARLRETVIFKVLGATRKRILTVHLMEYLVLAALSATIALLLGGAAAYAIVTYGMEMVFAFSWWVVLQIVALVVLLILPLGLLGTWRILGQKSTTYLRQA